MARNWSSSWARSTKSARTSRSSKSDSALWPRFTSPAESAGIVNKNCLPSVTKRTTQREPDHGLRQTGNRLTSAIAVCKITCTANVMLGSLDTLISREGSLVDKPSMFGYQRAKSISCLCRTGSRMSRRFIYQTSSRLAIMPSSIPVSKKVMWSASGYVDVLPSQLCLIIIL